MITVNEFVNIASTHLYSTSAEKQFLFWQVLCE